jgi:Zn-dependent M32 family carboxypeptidase
MRRGRLDPTHHPFAIEFSIDDVRITTRGRHDYLVEALACTFHESGHGMYHQGLDPRLEATLLADGTSAGVHESQSRMWENRIGRSRAFWSYAFGPLQAAFPDQLADVAAEAFYRAMNVVRPGVIRTRADELTYDLHVIVRFELELLDGTLAIADLSEAWHAGYEEVVGVRADIDRDGVLQDVHWFSGPIGDAFQGYTLGRALPAREVRGPLPERRLNTPAPRLRGTGARRLPRTARRGCGGRRASPVVRRRGRTARPPCDHGGTCTTRVEGHEVERRRSAPVGSHSAPRTHR